MPDGLTTAQTADQCIVRDMRIRLLMQGFDLFHAAAAVLDTITEEIELLDNAEGADDTEVTAASPAPADEAAVDPAPVHPVADGDNTIA